MIFGNIVYVCNTCEKKCSACWWCFSWLGQKVKASICTVHACRLRYVILIYVDTMAYSIDFRWLCVLNCFLANR